MSEKGCRKMSKIVDLCAANPNLTFHQITNASLLTRKNIQKLRGIKKVALLLSIDGNDPISYASIRKRGTLHKTLSNIRNLRKNLSEIGVTSASLQLSMTVMKRNVFTIPSMIELAKEIDAFLFVDHVQNFNQEFDKSESLYNFPVFSNYFLQQCRELADAYGVKILFQHLLPYLKKTSSGIMKLRPAHLVHALVCHLMTGVQSQLWQTEM